MANGEITEEEAIAEVEVAFKKLFRAVVLGNLTGIASFEGKTTKGENFSGNLEVEKPESNTYCMKIDVEIK